MKKTFKKALAIAIVFVMVFSMVPAVFAGVEPYPTNYDPELYARNVAISRDNAAEGMVLMENNGILPLDVGANVAVFGICAKNTIKGGGGSGNVNTLDADLKKIDQGLQDAGLVLDADVLTWYGTQGTGQVDVAIADGLVEAAATRTDTAIYVLGRTSSEGGDRTIDGNNPYNLTAIERANFDRVFAAFDNVVVILNEGAVSDVGWIEEYQPDAVLFAGLGGHAGGAAVGDVVTGIKNPSGKFADTWAYDVNDYPARNNFSQAGSTEQAFYTSIITSSGLSTTWTTYPAVAHVEDIYVGYRYFETFNIPVKYEFGYGMSYTTFELSDLSAKIEGDNLVATATVTNTGNYAGKEVVQVYMSAPDGTLEKPAKELKGYAKTDELNPGMTQTVTITTPLYWLASYSEDMEAWILDAGTYNFYVGTSVKQVELAGSWKLNALRLVEQSSNAATETLNGRTVDFPILSKFDDEATRIAKLQKHIFPTAVNPADVVIPGTDIAPLGRYPGDHWLYTSQEQVPADWVNWSNTTEALARNQEDFQERRIIGSPRTLLDVYNGTTTMDAYIRQFSAEDLTRLSRGGGTARLLPGAAAHTFELDYFGVPQTSLPDGPAGLRITLNPSMTDADGNTVVQKATMFPQGMLNAQTWNTDLVFDAGMAVGDEMVHFGASFWLAPGMNIHRDPLNGRNFEYYSEDPFLSGSIAAAMTRGVQSSGGVAVTLKHFYANSQEYRRTSIDTVMSNRAAREIYLRNFEYAIKEANPRAIMTCYNHVNGEHPNHNSALLNDLVRGEWGFNGIYMYDWGAYGDGYLEGESGVNWIMGSASGGRLIQLENASYYKRDVMVQRVKEVLTEIMRQRSFTEPNGLPTWYAPDGPMYTQTIEKSDVKVSQTASLSGPAVYGKTNNLTYTVSLARENVGVNTFIIEGKFDANALEYVDTEVLIPNATTIKPVTFDAEGNYRAMVLILAAGSLFKAPTVTPIVKINFTIKQGGSDIIGTLTKVSVTEVVSSSVSNQIACGLDPAEVVTEYVPYDHNDDGIIDMSDISLIIFNYYMVGQGDSKWDEAKIYDANGSGRIDMMDILLISTYVSL